MSADTSVVITGTGAVCALGRTVDEVVGAALDGATGIGPTRALLDVEGYLPATGDGPTRWSAGLVPGPPAGRSTSGSRSTGYALVAADEALAASGLSRDDGDGTRRLAAEPERVGVINGSAAPAADMYFALGHRAMADGLDGMDGRIAPHLSAHAPAAAIALAHGLRGPNLATSAACATGALVVLAARDQILAGRADAVLVVVSESAVSAVGLESFARAKALGSACRPFDRERDGLVFGEGAAAMVVERASHAAARGAAPLATLAGGALTNDAHHMWAPDTATWARTITAALEDAGAAPADVEYVSAHAAGTRIGDAAEVAAVKQALGPRAHEVPVWSTKGMHGHAFAASGGLELVIAVHALRAGRVPSTVGLGEAAPECDLDHVPDAGRPGAPGVLLKDSFGFGGTNCVLVLDVEPAGVR